MANTTSTATRIRSVCDTDWVHSRNTVNATATASTSSMKHRAGPGMDHNDHRRTDSAGEEE